MSDDGVMFSVVQKDGIVKFVNDSPYQLVIYSKPVKPKRKYTKIIIIGPNSFNIMDIKDEEKGIGIELTELIFSLEKINEIRDI